MRTRRSSPTSGSGTGAGAGGVGVAALLPLPTLLPAFSRSGRLRREELRLMGILEDLSVLRETLVIAENSEWSSSEVKSSS